MHLRLHICISVHQSHHLCSHFKPLSQFLGPALISSKLEDIPFSQSCLESRQFPHFSELHITNLEFSAIQGDYLLWRKGRENQVIMLASSLSRRESGKEAGSIFYWLLCHFMSLLWHDNWPEALSARKILVLFLMLWGDSFSHGGGGMAPGVES